MSFDLILQLPFKWRWNIDKPLPENRGTVEVVKPNGKLKREPRTYTVYVTNGEIIGSALFAWAMVDSDSVDDALAEAIEGVRRMEEQKREQLNVKRKPDDRRRR